MAELKPRPAHRLTNEQIERLAAVFATLTPGQLAALSTVRDAARRGASVAMRATERDRLSLGMAAPEAIIAATGVRR